jgi:hypothetical protein
MTSAQAEDSPEDTETAPLRTPASPPPRLSPGPLEQAMIPVATTMLPTTGRHAFPNIASSLRTAIVASVIPSASWVSNEQRTTDRPRAIRLPDPAMRLQRRCPRFPRRLTERCVDGHPPRRGFQSRSSGVRWPPRRVVLPV